MATQGVVMEGEFLQESEQNDPDLNKAFYDFIDTVNAEANSGGTIKVFRVPTDAAGNPRPKTQGKSTLFSVPVGACTFDDICDRVVKDFMNPGEKTTIQLMATQDGKSGIRFNRMITLEKGRGEYVNGGASGEIAQLMRLMNEQRAQDRAEMRETLSQLASNRAPPGDPMQQAMALTTVITNLATGIVSKAQPAAAAPAENMVASMTAMFGLLKMMKGFMGGDAEPKNESAGILENIRAIAAPLMAARASSEERALVAEKRMLAHERAAVPAPSAAPAPVPQAPAPEQTTTAAKPPSEESKMKLMAMLKETLPFLVEIAINKSDPTDTARIALKEIPEDDHDLSDALYVLTQEDDCLKQMAVLEPRVMEHKEWFEKFRVALRDEFDPDRVEAKA